MHLEFSLPNPQNRLSHLLSKTAQISVSGLPRSSGKLPNFGNLTSDSESSVPKTYCRTFSENCPKFGFHLTWTGKLPNFGNLTSDSESSAPKTYCRTFSENCPKFGFHLTWTGKLPNFGNLTSDSESSAPKTYCRTFFQNCPKFGFHTTLQICYL